jgi:hypothetical protein
MPTPDEFADTFAKLRRVLTPYARTMIAHDEPGDFRISSRTQTDRIGRPLFVAAVQIKKNYVSFHLMPVYACPGLAKAISPALRKRMQGKSCFNFKTIDPSQLKELSALTKRGVAGIKKVKMPWDDQ